MSDDGLEKRDPKGWVDLGVEKLTSRKLLAFCVATGLLLTNHLTSDWWGFICCAYIGSQGVVDLIATLKNAGK